MIKIRPYLKNVGTKTKKLISEFKGLYTAFGEESCPEGFSPFMKNISAVSYPQLKEREGRSEYSRLDGEILFMGVIEGRYLSCVEKKGGICTWKYYSDGWKDICQVYESETGRYDMLYFLNATILVCGKKQTDSGIEKTVSYALTFESGVAKAVTETQMPFCDMIDTIGGRLAVACSEGEKVFLGGIMDRGVWFDIDNGLEQNMITQSCENISAIKTYGGHLVCFKPHSFGEIYGNTPDSYTMIMVSESMGCIAEKSICDCGKLLWLSEEGIVSYGGGSLPKVISSAVQKYIDNFDMGRAAECCSGCDGVRYIISLPQKGGRKINLVLNLESGAFVAEDERDFRFFANMNGALYGADAEGRICKMWDSESGEAISWQWESPVFKIDFLKKMSLRRIYVSGRISGRFNIKIINDKGEVSEKEITVSERELSGKESFYINLHPSFFSARETFQIVLSGSGKGTIYGLGALIRNRDISY